MSEIKLGSGIRIENADGIMLASGRRTERNLGPVEAIAEASILDEALREAGYTIAADVELSPATTMSQRRAAEDQVSDPRIIVPVRPEESAVLLIESAGGVFVWRQPAASSAASSGRRTHPATELIFELREPQARRPRSDGRRSSRRSILGWIDDQLVEPIRIRVLKFVARKTIESLVEHIEEDHAGGLVPLHGDPADWSVEAQPTLPQISGARVLLLLHGTFSSTSGSYAALASTESGCAFLNTARERYDAILGFDHKTLTKDPFQNAQDLAEALQALPQGTQVDAIAFSRGGLVYRALRETIKPDGLVFGKAIFIGCTNGGTSLACPERWNTLVDLYTTIAVASVSAIGDMTGVGAAPMISFLIKTVGRFVQAMADLGTDDTHVPGLAAMRPDGDFIQKLNANTVDVSDYRVIAADFEPRLDLSKGLTAELVAFLIDRISDRLMGEANDLVVQIASMRNFGPTHTLPANHIFRLSPNDTVYHTIYFSSPRTMEALKSWLIEDITVKGAPPRRRLKPAIKDASIGQAALPSIDKGDDRLTIATLAESRPPEATAAIDCNFTAQIEPTPPALTPVPLCVTVTPNKIRLEAGPSPAPTEKAVSVDAGEPIEILVTPLSNCRLLEENDDAGRATMIPPTARAKMVWFVLEGFGPGPARIQVEARQDGALLAALLLKPTFVPVKTGDMIVGQMVTARPRPGNEPTVLTIHEIAHQDRSLEIRYTVDSRDPPIAVLQSVRLRSGFNLPAFVAEYLQRLDNAHDLDIKSYEAKRRDLLAFAARTADELMPEEVRRKLWEKHSQIKAIQIVADSPHIPWELLAITDPDGASSDDIQFLCEWGLVRRLPGSYLADDNLPLRPDRVRYVVPDYLDTNNRLTFAPKEQSLLEMLFPGAKPIEATSEAVIKFLRTEACECDLLHFCCHGETKQRAALTSELVLKGIREQSGMIADDLLSHYAVSQAARFGKNRPTGLIFINACQTGQGGTHISGSAAGFADAFLRPKSRQGAAALVAALWSVNDEQAVTFASTFYNCLLKGSTYIEASKAARDTCKPPAQADAATGRYDFTWLAYSFYGNPFARAVST